MESPLRPGSWYELTARYPVPFRGRSPILNQRAENGAGDQSVVSTLDGPLLVVLFPGRDDIAWAYNYGTLAESVGRIALKRLVCGVQERAEPGCPLRLPEGE